MSETRGRLKECKLDEAVARKYPEQVVLATSVGKDGKPNIIALGWMMFCSGNPPMVAIAVGKARHSHKLLSEIRQFVCAFPGEDLEQEMLYCGTRSGRDVDKFKETGLTAGKAKVVAPPLIEECVANLECEVVHEYDSGSHSIFVGKIVAAWISEEGKRRLYNLGGGKFAGLP